MPWFVRLCRGESVEDVVPHISADEPPAISKIMIAWRLSLPRWIGFIPDLSLTKGRQQE
jgi:hypothetical protein